MQDAPKSATPRPGIRGILLRIALVAVIVVGLHLLTDRALDFAERSANARMMSIGLLAAILVAYALLIAVPFVPGIEIGLSLLALRGAEVAPFVYAATVAGLMLAYGAGRHLSPGWLEQALRRWRLSRAADLVAEVGPMSETRRLAYLRGRLPERVSVAVVNGRYAILALLINMPGSGLIGGGGGICLVAGVARVFTPRATLLTLALAVAPLPLLAYATGFDPAGVFSFL